MKFKHERLKELREKKRYTTKRFCDLMQISRHTLWAWETGKRVPKENNIRLIAKILDISLDMITDSPDKELESGCELTEALTRSFYIPEQGSRQNKNIEKVIQEIRLLNDILEKYAITVKALFSTMQSICYIKDIEQRYIIASPKFLENLSLHELFNVRGKNDYDFFTRKEAEENAAQDLWVFSTGQPIVNLEGYIPGSKKKKWGLISKHPIFDSDGNVIAVVGKILDITEKKQLEQIREILESNLSSMNQLITVYNKTRKSFLYINKAVETVSGYSLDILYKGGTDFWIKNCVHPDDRERLKNYLQADSWPERYEYRIVRPDEEVKCLEVRHYSEITYSNTKCHLTFAKVK